MMKKLLLALLVLVPGIASAQVTPWPTSTTPPIFGNPSAVDGGGSFGPQLFGPQSCTVPAYAFTGATTSGFGLASSTACVVVGGVPYFNLSANLAQLRNSTTAQRWDVANTWASTISNELFSVDWQTHSNQLFVGTRAGTGGGTGRAVLFGSSPTGGSNTYVGLRAHHNTSTPIVIGFTDINGTGQSFTAFTSLLSLGVGTNAATSGTFTNTAILPTYNQSSGTAANTDLLINRTQTAVGSGAQNLIDAQVSTVSKFSVTNTGIVTAAGTIVGAALQLIPAGTLNFDTREVLSSPSDGKLIVRNQANTASMSLDSGAAANGQSMNLINTLTELTTIAASATTDTTIQMPAGAVVFAVSVRVTTVIPTAATFTVGDSGSAARFSTAAVSTAANSTDSGTKAGAYYNASALSIRITPNLTPANNTGRVRVTIYYYSITPPTS